MTTEKDPEKKKTNKLAELIKNTVKLGVTSSMPVDDDDEVDPEELLEKKQPKSIFTTALVRERPTKVEMKPKPIDFKVGLDINNAIAITRDLADIYRFLDHIFTYTILDDDKKEVKMVDGGYFIKNETTIRNRGRQFRIMTIEDRNGFFYRLWFDITKTSLLHNISYTY